MNLNFLDFEQPIAELEAKIEELRYVGNDTEINISEEIARLQEKSQVLTETIFSNLNAWQISQLARHPQRPYTQDYIDTIFTDYQELHGDRSFADDAAIIGGIARLEGKPVMAGPDSAVVQVASTALGINSQITFAMDARTGAALQSRNIESGRRVRERIYRYTDTGAALWTRRPTEGDEDAPLDSWPQRIPDFRPYPAPALGEKIIDPTGLLYIVAASDLAAPGDSLELVVYVRKQAARLVVTADKLVNVAELTRGNKSLAGLLASAGATQALVLRLDPQPLAGPEDVEFEFLGLNRDIKIWLEPKTRLPMRVQDKAKIAGEVTINLVSAELKSKPGKESPANCEADPG